MVQRTHKWCSVMSNNFVEHQTLYLNIKLLSITRNISMLWRIVELARGMTCLAETTKNTNRKWNSDLLGA